MSPPKTRKYDAEAHRKPPTLVMKRTITSLDQDPEAAAMLLKRIPEWRAEADRLEAQLANLTLPERLATLMFKVDVPLKIKEQEKEWDPNGGGTITLGEFRQHIRGVGLEASNEDIDALFQQWDKDGGGTLDLTELEAALLAMREDFLLKFGEDGWKVNLELEAEKLRARAVAGKVALEASRKAESQEAELRALLSDIEGRVGVQLGIVLVARKIRVGEVVGTWCKTKGNAARRELTREEFKDEVYRLDVRVHGEAVGRKVLGELFDTVDSDKNGWLDMAEAQAALKKWEAEAIRASAERTTKEKQVRRIKNLASRKLQAALREPSAAKGAMHDEGLQGVAFSSDVDGRPPVVRTGSPTSRAGSPNSSTARRASPARKRLPVTAR